MFLGEIENKEVLELGAGTGVNGLICAKLNASSVICSDGDIKSVNLCVQNAMLNKQFDVASRIIDWGDRGKYLLQGKEYVPGDCRGGRRVFRRARDRVGKLRRASFV